MIFEGTKNQFFFGLGLTRAGLSVPDSGMLISLAVAGTLLHGFEYFFVRLAPFVFIASVTGIVLTYKKP